MAKECWRSLKDVKTPKEISGLGCPPCASVPIENIGENFEKPTPNNPEGGAKVACPAALEDAPVSKRKNAMSLYAKDGHKRIAKAVGYALTLGTSAAWHGLTFLLVARLNEAERAGLAYAALRSLNKDNAHSVASLAIFGATKGEVAR
ncbi:hypothetical protein [Phaeobacter inhibens]|uniref:hypothetical protein n=1 Tax=Phaeobacter inhibens TaxID=221822 RepID=UPI000C9A28A6|nr:hypothetical protein [Phaeobacter inhibens]AUQ55175.1 hypothetical protein PhaeoP92_02521 [Phaeobacter inhibens]AUQ79191.1 hypothetical protein PhaeoP74_02522 [Phaeobacter inhibens]AUR16350.1 hypothetical protein PhaeoP70_02520 [Phaeobacter inhibens]